MTVGFGFPATLFLLGLVVLVFVLFSAAAKEAGYKLNLGDSETPKKEEYDGGYGIGAEGPGIYLDNDEAWPVHKIG